MRIAIAERPGERFRLAEAPVPSPQVGEVLVQIHASGINPLDAKIRAGGAPHARHPLPAVLGLDLAGRIVRLGAGVTAWREGDEVYGMTGGVGGLQGSLAEYAAVDARLIAPKPRALTMRQAAATPLVFITAWEGLVDRARVQPGQRVLIQGGAGGVGQVAVQIALAHGADVFATASGTRGAMIERLGARAIDYRTTSVDDYVAHYTAGEGFDVVYDTVGGEALDASFRAVRRFGHVVSALGWGTHSLAPLSMRAATYSGVFTLLPILTGTGRERHGEILRLAKNMADSGKFTPTLDPRRFTLDTVEDAYEAMAGGHASGKLVIDVLQSGETGGTSQAADPALTDSSITNQ